MQVHRSRRSATVVEVMLWVAAFGLVGATVVYSLGPAPAALHAFPLADKVFHAGAYGGITVTWLLAAVWRPGRGAGPIASGALAVVTCAVVLGAGVEIAQHFAHRDAEVFDAVADGIGAALGLAAWGAVRRLDGTTPRP